MDYDGQAIDPTAKGRPEEFPQRVVMLIQQERRRHGIQAHDSLFELSPRVAR